MKAIISKKIKNKYDDDLFQLIKEKTYKIISKNSEIKCHINQETQTVIVNIQGKLKYNTDIFFKVIKAISKQENLNDIIINYSQKNKKQIENKIGTFTIKETNKKHNSISTTLTQEENTLEIQKMNSNLETKTIICKKCQTGKIKEKKNNKFPELGFKYYMCNNCEYKTSTWKKIEGINLIK